MIVSANLFIFNPTEFPVWQLACCFRLPIADFGGIAVTFLVPKNCPSIIAHTS